MRTEIGYQTLAKQYKLRRIDDWPLCFVDTAIRHRREKDLGSHTIRLFPSQYQPESDLAGQLQFALRYEGVNLQLLALLYEK